MFIGQLRAAIDIERAARLPSHPLHQLTTGHQPPIRIKICSFMKSYVEAIRATILIGLTEVELLLVGPPKHDRSSTENVSFHVTSAERSFCLWSAATSPTNMLNLHAVDGFLWTDGSAMNGIDNGSDGGVITTSINNYTFSVAAGLWCSSYRAVMSAIDRGLSNLPTSTNQT